MVSQDALNEINNKLSDSSTVISSAYAKLYTTDNKSGQWKDSLLFGVLVIIVERTLQTVLIRLYDLEKFEMVFETELYYNFASFYHRLSKLFYHFPVTGGHIGFSFSDEIAGESFYEQIKIYSPKEKLKSNKSEHDLSDVKPTWLDKLKQKVLKKKQKSRKNQIEISKPYAVQLVSRVEWDDTKKTYILDSLPLELRRIFLPEIKNKNLEVSMTSSGFKSKKPTIEIMDSSRKPSYMQTNKPILSYRNTKIKSFEELEEKILGSRKSTAIEGIEPRIPTNSKPPVSNYYSLLASKIAERKAELDKYNISEEASESSSYKS
jgi:WH1 domain